jgi:hypothetical protein
MPVSEIFAEERFCMVLYLLLTMAMGAWMVP